MVQDNLITPTFTFTLAVGTSYSHYRGMPGLSLQVREVEFGGFWCSFVDGWLAWVGLVVVKQQ